jgi:hypothetical protein
MAARKNAGTPYRLATDAKANNPMPAPPHKKLPAAFQSQCR